MADKLLSAQAVATRFEPPISTRTIDRLTRNPQSGFPAPAKVIGRTRYWLESDIGTYLSRGRAKAAA